VGLGDSPLRGGGFVQHRFVNQKPTNARSWPTFFGFMLLMIVVLAVLFRASFDPDKVIFSNDGPHGLMKAAALDYSKNADGGVD
jgi:hypothetical protein